MQCTTYLRPNESRNILSMLNRLFDNLAHITFGIALCIISLGVLVASTQEAYAQTQKTMLYEDMHGQQTESPYITQQEFEDILIGEKARLGELLTVESVDEAIRLLGTPNSRDVVEINATSYLEKVDLVYDGFSITYLKTTIGTFLFELKTTTSKWPVQIGDTKVSPGMSTSKLSEAVQSATQSAKSDEMTSLSYVKLDASEAKSQRVKEMSKHTTIEIKFNEQAGKVVWFRIQRVI